MTNDNKLMDTQELSEIRKLIGEEELPKGTDLPAEKPVKPETEYSLNDIMAEVSGAAERATRPGAPPQDTASRPAVQPGQRAGVVPPVSQGTARIPRTTGRVPQGTMRVPQVTGRIPHTPGINPKEAEERLQATAELQARMLADMTKEDEDDPRMSRRERKRAEKIQRRQEIRADKERRKEQERVRDREDDVEIRDPHAAQRYCKKRARSLARRSILVLIFGLLALYITIGGGMGLPLPGVMQFAAHPYLTIMALVMLQFAAMFAGLDVFSVGIYNLFSGKADRSSLVVCSLIASLLHGVTMLLLRWSVLLPYCAISILLLFAQMHEEKARLAGRYRAYKTATLGSRPTGVYAHHDTRDHVRRSVKYRMEHAKPFLREMERNDHIDIFERIYTPLAIAAALVFAVIASFASGAPDRFFWVLSAVLSISAPFGILLAFGAAYRNVSRKLLAEGAAMPSARQASRLCRVKEAVLRDGDIFPAGSITVEEIRNFGSYTPEKLLAYASAVTDGQGLEIGRVLSESLREQYGRPMRASNVTHYESGGISADIAADSVLVGTASFLSKLGIRQPDSNARNSVIYVVINSQIAGEITLAYHPTAQTYGAIHAFTRLKIRPVIAARDFNISPAMIETMFEMKHGTTDAIDPARIAEISDPRYADRDAVGAILSKDGAMPLAAVQHAADQLVGALRANLLIGTVAGICGMLLMFYLTYHNAQEAVEPKNVLLYLLLWYVPVLFITLSTRRKD